MKFFHDNFIRLYLFAFLLIGLGFIFSLPAFEGFDEYAHYSRIRAGYFNSYKNIEGNRFVDKTLINYEGPWFYSSGNPPFNLGYNYQKFFSRAPESSSNYILMYRERSFDIPFKPSNVLNYQNQHPPLYYALLSNLTKYFPHLSFVDHLDLMRVISYLLVCFGISISYKTIINNLKIDKQCVRYGFLIYPLLFPMFYLEFARVGNDSLCFLLTSILLNQTLKWIKKPNSLMSNISIGFIFGFGLITKALFIPIFIVLSIFFLIHYLKKNHKKNIFQAYPIFLMILSAFCSGGFWYLYNFLVNHNYGIGNEMSNSTMWPTLYTKLINGNNLADIFHDAFATLVTFIWAGTQSLTRVKEIYYAPLIIFILWFVNLYLKSERNNNNYFEFSKLPIWLFIFFYGSLFIHTLVSNLFFNEGSSGGWYMHILMPWFMIALIKGVSCIKKEHLKYLFFLLLFSNLFIFNAFLCNLTLFSGYSIKGHNKHFEFTDQIVNMETFYRMIQRVNILNYATIGSMLFLTGIILYSYIFIKNYKKLY